AQFLWHGDPNAPRKDIESGSFDAVQQSTVALEHGPEGRPAIAMQQRQQGFSAPVVILCPIHFKSHQLVETIVRTLLAQIFERIVSPNRKIHARAIDELEEVALWNFKSANSIVKSREPGMGISSIADCFFEGLGPRGEFFFLLRDASFRIADVVAVAHEGV